MKSELEKLIWSLREELTQYGELLALLEQQHELIVSGSAEGLLENLGAINAQVPVVAALRERRDEARKSVATAMGQPTTLTLRQLIGLISCEYGPLLEALVDEVNDALGRAQQRLRQNHLMLSRSLNQMQKVIASLFPSSDIRTYTENGQVRFPGLVASGLCDAIV